MIVGNIFLKGHINSIELQDFDIYAGDTKYLNFDIVGEEGMPLDISGCTFLWVAKKNVKAKNVITKSVGNGIEIYSSQEGKIKVRLDSIDSTKMKDDYYHELELTDTDGNVSTLSSGAMKVLPSGANAAGIPNRPPDTVAPENVTNLEYDNLTSSSVRLTWTASSSLDTTGYYIYNGLSWVSTVVGTAVNITGLQPSTIYTFIIKARDGAGNIASGTQVIVTTPNAEAPGDTTAPEEVTNIVATNVGETGFTISWTASQSEDIFEYDVHLGGSYIATTTQTNYTFTGLTASTLYEVVIKSVDSSGNTSAGASINVSTTAAPVGDEVDGGGFTETPTVTLDGGSFTEEPAGEVIDGGAF